MALEKRREEERDAEHLTDLISAMRKDDDGMITLEEFLVQAHEPHADAYLKSLGIDINNASMFFNLLQRIVGTGELPIHDFVSKLVNMKGNAKALDLHTLAFEVSVVRNQVSQIASTILKGQRASRIESGPGRMSARFSTRCPESEHDSSGSKRISSRSPETEHDPMRAKRNSPRLPESEYGSMSSKRISSRVQE